MEIGPFQIILSVPTNPSFLPNRINQFMQSKIKKQNKNIFTVPSCKGKLGLLGLQ